MTTFTVRAADQYDCPGAGTDIPGPDLALEPQWINTRDRKVQVLAVVKIPTLVVFGNLLSDEECDELVSLATTRLQRSTTPNHESGISEVNPGRTSQGTFLQLAEFPICERIERRLAELVRWPSHLAEGLQILKYEPGDEYLPHHDYFDPTLPGMARQAATFGQRVASLIMYLKAPEAGGATAFPFAGLDVSPVKGTGVFFSYPRPHPDTRTLHAGKPVLAGEKFVATKWFRLASSSL